MYEMRDLDDQKLHTIIVHYPAASSRIGTQAADELRSRIARKARTKGWRAGAAGKNSDAAEVIRLFVLADEMDAAARRKHRFG